MLQELAVRWMMLSLVLQCHGFSLSIVTCCASSLLARLNHVGCLGPPSIHSQTPRPHIHGSSHQAWVAAALAESQWCSSSTGFKPGHHLRCEAHPNNITTEPRKTAYGRPQAQGCSTPTQAATRRVTVSRLQPQSVCLRIEVDGCDIFLAMMSTIQQ